MKRTVIAALVLTLLAIAVNAMAEDEISCADAKFSEVQSLKRLPPELLSLLNEMSGSSGLADRGEDFSPGCLGAAPHRRFTFGKVSENCAVVGIEVGGRAHIFTVESFRRTASGWQKLEPQEAAIFFQQQGYSSHGNN